MLSQKKTDRTVEISRDRISSSRQLPDSDIFPQWNYYSFNLKSMKNNFIKETMNIKNRQSIINRTKNASTF
jgi:hypothetical protein